MRALKLFALITALTCFFSLNNVFAAEGGLEILGDQDEIMVDVLTEGKKKEAQELERKVLEDMKNNPDKVQYAVPVDGKQDGSISVLATTYLPYTYSFNFYDKALRGRDFRSVSGYGTLRNQMKITSSAYVTYSLYTLSGTFVGSRIYAGNSTSTSTFKITPGAIYYSILSGPSGTFKTGTGSASASLY